jgi:hypothetical protein
MRAENVRTFTVVTYPTWDPSYFAHQAGYLPIAGNSAFDGKLYLVRFALP